MRKYSSSAPADQYRVRTKKPTAPAGTMGRSAHRKCVDECVSRWAWTSTRSSAQQTRATEMYRAGDTLWSAGSHRALLDLLRASHVQGKRRHGDGSEGQQRAAPRRHSVSRRECPRDGLAYASTSSGSSSSTGRTSHISIVSMSA